MIELLEGWYPDPLNPDRLRFFDGSKWSDDVHPKVSTSEPPTQAGWFPDPLKAGRSRYFDGHKWTDEVRPIGSLEPDTAGGAPTNSGTADSAWSRFRPPSEATEVAQVTGQSRSAREAPIRATPVPRGQGPVEVGSATVLSTITLGIYWLFWIYPAFQDYARKADRSASNSTTLFWTYVGTLAATFIFALFFFPLALIAIVAAVVVSGMLVNDIVRNREIAIERAGGDPTEQARGLQVTLYVLANVFAATVCGIVIAIPLTIWFYLIFFRGHNEYVRETSRLDQAGAP